MWIWSTGAEMTNRLGWNDELWDCLYNFFFYLFYDILVCSNVFYNIFYMCNEVLMWY